MAGQIAIITWNLGGDSRSEDEHEARVRDTANVLNALIERARKKGQHVVVCFQECRLFWLENLLRLLPSGMKLVPVDDTRQKDGRPIIFCSSGVASGELRLEGVWYKDLIKADLNSKEEMFAKELMSNSNGSTTAGDLTPANAFAYDCADNDSESHHGAEPAKCAACGPPADSGDEANFELVDEDEQGSARAKRAARREFVHDSMTVARFCLTCTDGDGDVAKLRFLMANVHILCVLQSNCYRAARRVEQGRVLRLISRQRQAECGLPLFVCGDFNQDHDAVFSPQHRGAKSRKLEQPQPGEPSEWATHCLSLWQEARQCVPESGAQDRKHGWPHGSYHGWLAKPLTNANRIIDWILVTRGTPAARPGVAPHGGEAAAFESGRGLHACSVEVLGAELCSAHPKWHPAAALASAPSSAGKQPGGPWSDEEWKAELCGWPTLAHPFRRACFPADHFPVLAEVRLRLRSSGP